MPPCDSRNTAILIQVDMIHYRRDIPTTNFSLTLLERRASILCTLTRKRLASAFRLLGGNEHDIPRQKLERASLGEPTFLRFFVVINFFQFLS